MSLSLVKWILLPTTKHACAALRAGQILHPEYLWMENWFSTLFFGKTCPLDFHLKTNREMKVANVSIFHNRELKLKKEKLYFYSKNLYIIASLKECKLSWNSVQEKKCMTSSCVCKMSWIPWRQSHILVAAFLLCVT